MIPEIPARRHGDFPASSPDYEHFFHARAFGQGRVGVVLQGHDPPGPETAVTGEKKTGLAIINAIGQGLCAEPAENHTVDRPDPGGGQHADDQLRYHGKIEHDPVAFFHSQFFKYLGQFVDLVKQFLIGEGAAVADALPFKEDGGLVPPPGLDVPVQTVESSIQLSALKPRCITPGKITLQGFLPGLVPDQQFLCFFGPVSFRVLDGSLIFAVIRLSSGYPGLLLKMPGTGYWSMISFISD